MKRRRAVLNSALGLALVGVGVGAYLSVSQADQSVSTARTVTVSRGTLTSSVTATGNAEVVTSIGVALEGSSGVVRAIYVHEGQKVTQGQKLLRIDATSAKDALETAKIGLASAQASYETTTQGQSAAELAQSNASIASSRTSLKNARTGLSQARASYALDKRQQGTLVDLAGDAVDSANDQLRTDQQAYDAATDPTTKATLAKTVAGDQSAVDAAEKTQTQAKLSRDSTLLKDRQSIQSQNGQVDSAEDALRSQVAAANVASEPARAGQVKSAQAQVDNAQISVDQAQEAVDETVLRAPAAGTVAAISAVKGESSGSSSSSSGTSSSSGSSTSTTASSSTASSSSTSGLVTLTDLDRKQVVASVAEADVTKVKVGQKVAVAFAATGATVAGSVTAIDTDDTVTNNVVTYGVTVTLDGNASGVRVGQSASMTITTGTVSDVLVAPASAITTVGDRSTVVRRVNGVDSPVVVETGLVGTTGTEITSGLDEGDVLVIQAATASATSTATTSGRSGLGGIAGGPR